jgi:indolepyruvate ferredoxin oxidoreductase beta subunit
VTHSAENHRGHSGRRIVIVGTGGQGALTAARLLCDCLAERGHNVVSGQLHGMAQRGGSVLTSIKIDCGISPVIAGGTADCVLGFEPAETARAIPLMRSGTVVFMNTTPVVPFVLGQQAVLKPGTGRYPSVSDLIESIRAVATHVFPFDATQLAQESGSVKTINTIMLGCLLGSGLLPCTDNEFWQTVTRVMPPKLTKANAKAFSNGVEVGKQLCLEEAMK